jgi:chemosensory pili system protein ChpA (sensor histidine kinase/response regulator)
MSSIFLVEDDEYIMRVYERAFRLAGHSITIATDGEMALKDLSEMKDLPSAIILDVMMPKKNGENVLRELRADARYANIPIAVLSNSFHEDQVHRFKELGANLYMVKIDNKPSDVIEKIEGLIRTSDSLVAPSGT